MFSVSILLVLLIAGALGFATATVAWFSRWQGVWRWLALVPAGGVAFVILRIILDTSTDPTAHNLWPIELLIWGGVALGALLLLGLCHALFVRSSRSGEDGQ